MVQINFAQKQVNAKIVYYGPGMSGKTTNLEVIHQRAPEGNRGELTSISTDGDRTLFFDFMPLDLGTVAGMRTCFQIYTVPGQVYYNSTRKLVLQGVDGVIFVADSSPDMMEENIESMKNLETNLIEYGRSVEELPLVIQYNKRDVPGALPIEELEAKLNTRGVPAFEGMASTGQGVFPTLKAVAACVLDSLHKNQQSAAAPAGSEPAPVAAPAPAPGSIAASPEPMVAAPEPIAVAPAPVAAAPEAPAPTPQAPAEVAAASAQSAPAPPADRPTISMSQTGFHRAPSLPLDKAAPAPTAAGEAPVNPQPAMAPAAPQAEASSLQMAAPTRPQPASAMPPGSASVQVPPQAAQPPAAPPPAQPPQRQQPPPPPAPQGQQPPPAPQGQQAATAVAPPAQAQQQTAQGSLMRVESSSSVPQRRSPSPGTFPSADPQSVPRPRPTPKGGKSKKSAVLTGIIILVSVAAGAVIGSFVLSIL